MRCKVECNERNTPGGGVDCLVVAQVANWSLAGHPSAELQGQGKLCRRGWSEQSTQSWRTLIQRREAYGIEDISRLKADWGWTCVAWSQIFLFSTRHPGQGYFEVHLFHLPLFYFVLPLASYGWGWGIPPSQTLPSAPIDSCFPWSFKGSGWGFRSSSQSLPPPPMCSVGFPR
jgi:hypothetical protein